MHRLNKETATGGLSGKLKYKIMNTSIYSGLLFTTKEINLNFRIKVDYINEFGKKVRTLLGVAGLIKLIGVEFVNKFIGRAFKSGLDKTVCKLRRGIRVSLYVK